MPKNSQKYYLDMTYKRLTLNISNTLLEDLLENLGVLKLLVDLGNDGLGKLALLALLDLALVAHPGVKDLLGLGGEGSTLLEFVDLGLELGGFLEQIVNDRGIDLSQLFLPWKRQRAAW